MTSMKDDIGSMASDQRQFTLIYNSQTSIGKQTFGYVQGIAAKVRDIDISKTKIADTIWVSLADELGVSLGDLFATDHPDAPDVQFSDFSVDDWIKMIQHNPVLLQHPIAFKGKHIIQVESPSKVMQLLQESPPAQ